MVHHINLSYIISTKNKLSFLKSAIAQLLRSKQQDEEIIIIDGGSTDGTKEYLLDLYNNKKIQCYLSETDKGEADAYNKGIGLARGILIKLISDDDAFYYPGIQKCKIFMLKNPSIDVLGTEGCATYINGTIASPSLNCKDYINWKRTRKPFTFCGLGLMIRKQALNKLGKFNIDFIRVDMEFTYRITAIGVNLGWYTGSTFIRILNPRSNSFKRYLKVNLEGIYLENKYLHRINFFQTPIVYLKSILLYFLAPIIKSGFKPNIKDIFLSADRKLLEINKVSPGKFFYNEPPATSQVAKLNLS